MKSTKSTIAARPRRVTMISVGVLTGLLTLAGCSRQDQNEARKTTDQAVAEVKQGAREVKQEAARGLDQAKVAANDLAKEAKVAGKTAGDQIGDKVSDAVITTGVKAEFAKDPDLSALQISVATDSGRVALHGIAPSDASLRHATTLAKSVKGVVRVDNELSVDPAAK